MVSQPWLAFLFAMNTPTPDDLTLTFHGPSAPISPDFLFFDARRVAQQEGEHKDAQHRRRRLVLVLGGNDVLGLPGKKKIT